MQGPEACLDAARALHSKLHRTPSQAAVLDQLDLLISSALSSVTQQPELPTWGKPALGDSELSDVWGQQQLDGSGTPVRRWQVEGGDMYTTTAANWLKRKASPGCQDSPPSPLVAVAECSDRRYLSALEGGGGGGTHDPTRVRVAPPAGCVKRTLVKVRYEPVKVKPGLSNRLVRSAAKRNKKAATLKPLKPDHCSVVVSLTTLAADTWQGHGHGTPEMLLVQCGSVSGVLKTTVPQRAWWEEAQQEEGATYVKCGTPNAFQKAAGCASYKKWITSVKTMVGSELLPVKAVPGVHVPGASSYLLAACLQAACGCCKGVADQ
jgi:SAND domain